MLYLFKINFIYEIFKIVNKNLVKIIYTYKYMDYDTNVNNYTDQEIFDLLEIENEIDVPVTAQAYIEKYSSNPILVKFYTDIRTRFESKVVKANELKKGILNAKHLGNTISRMINIDSTYREYSSTYVDDSKNYLFKLNEPITNVISLMLYSIEIPQGWYTFELSKGNTVFQPILIVQNNVTTQDADTFDDTSIVTKYVYPVLQINDGNYTSKSLVKDVTNLIRTCGIFINQPDTFRIEQDVYTGRAKITVTKDFLMQNIVLPPDPNSPSQLLNVGVYTACKIGFLFHSVPLKTKVNYNLGWLLGFRQSFYTIQYRLFLQQTKDTIDYSDSIIDTAGTKYIILQLDDFKTNRMNKNVVNISTKTDQTIALPSYYNRSLPQFQTSTTTVNVTSNTIGLTEKQIYTINSINNSYNTDINAIQVSFPNISDIFAKIPIKNHMEWGIVEADGMYNCCDSGPGKIIVEFSGPLQLATREYFGPVDITSFSVTLYDDKGFPLSLNGLDWSFTMIAKSIININ